MFRRQKCRFAFELLFCFLTSGVLNTGVIPSSLCMFDVRLLKKMNTWSTLCSKLCIYFFFLNFSIRKSLFSQLTYPAALLIFVPDAYLYC